MGQFENLGDTLGNDVEKTTPATEETTPATDGEETEETTPSQPSVEVQSLKLEDNEEQDEDYAMGMGMDDISDENSDAPSVSESTTETSKETNAEETNNYRAVTHSEEAEYNQANLRHYNPDNELRIDVDENLIDDLLKSVYLNETPEMVTTDWVGNSQLLLQYIVNMQHKYKLTLPLDSIGIATSMFDKIIADDNGYFSFNGDTYELVEVDGSCYLSCITKEINRDRFKRITQQMLSDLCDIGVFTLKRTSYNIFSVTDTNSENAEQSSTYAVSDVNENVLTRSLTLNTFEMQALYAYIDKLGGVEVTHSTDEDGFAIMIVKYTS